MQRPSAGSASLRPVSNEYQSLSREFVGSILSTEPILRASHRTLRSLRFFRTHWVLLQCRLCVAAEVLRGAQHKTTRTLRSTRLLVAVAIGLMVAGATVSSASVADADEPKYFTNAGRR